MSIRFPETNEEISVDVGNLSVGESTTEFREVVELRTGHGSLFTEDAVEEAVFMWVKSVPNGEPDDSDGMVEEMFCIPAAVAARLYEVLKFVMVHPSIIGQLELVDGAGAGGVGAG